MTRPPDRLLSTVAAARTPTSIKTLAPGGNLGTTLRARAVTRAGLRVLQAVGLFAVVFHGGDSTVTRPWVLLCFWVGAATPANGEPYDLWYPATI